VAKDTEETNMAANVEQILQEDINWPEHVEKLQKQIEKSQAELDIANDKMLRAHAEAENMRRRSVVELENAHKYSNEKFAKELLDVVDSFERALELSEQDTAESKMLEGINMTYKIMLDILAKYGMVRLNPINQKFDPKQHEALTAQETDEFEANIVIEVVQSGFLIHDRVLRPARVIVSKNAS